MEKGEFYGVVAQAQDMVPGFEEGYRKFEQQVVLKGLSNGLLENYGRNVAHLSLHFGRCPECISVEENNCYLYHRAVDDKWCESYIKHRFLLAFTYFYRTASLGGHVEQCDECGDIRISYNSCRNRHCPKCQGAQRDRWIESRLSEALDCKYFHNVFTLPDGLNYYCLHYPKAMYDILFKSSKETLECFGNDAKYLGAEIGCKKHQFKTTHFIISLNPSNNGRLLYCSKITWLNHKINHSM